MLMAFFIGSEDVRRLIPFVPLLPQPRGKSIKNTPSAIVGHIRSTHDRQFGQVHEHGTQPKNIAAE